MKYSAPLLVGAGFAAAQSTVVTVPLPDMEIPETIDASVVAAVPTATTYDLYDLYYCPPSADFSDCIALDKVELVYGPSTWEYTASVEDYFTAIANCELDLDMHTADCVETQWEDGSSTVETLTDLAFTMQPITVTAGLDKLAANTADPAASTTVTSPPPSGGVPPQMTQNAVLVGAAVLVGGAMLM
ncbi:hypothetical protein VTH06DRAFT_2920 [Thermothelomyces fergusii]